MNDIRALVRPLEWAKEWEGEYVAETRIGDAIVRAQRDHHGLPNFWWWSPTDDGGPTGAAPTIDAAKAAAQADYADRVLSALTDDALAALRAKMAEGAE